MSFDPYSYSAARVIHDREVAQALDRRLERMHRPQRPVRTAIGTTLIRIGQALGGRTDRTDVPSAVPGA